MLPECTFRGWEKRELEYAAPAAAAVHGGTEPDRLDEVASWQADDFRQHAMYAAVAYVRAAASRAGVPVGQACQDLDEPPAIWRCSADLVRLGKVLPRAADQMQIRRFCVRWYTIVIAAD